MCLIPSISACSIMDMAGVHVINQGNIIIDIYACSRNVLAIDGINVAIVLLFMYIYMHVHAWSDPARPAWLYTCIIMYVYTLCIPKLFIILAIIGISYFTLILGLYMPDRWIRGWIDRAILLYHRLDQHSSGIHILCTCIILCVLYIYYMHNIMHALFVHMCTFAYL